MSTPLHVCLVPLVWLAFGCEAKCPSTYVKEGGYCRVKDDTAFVAATAGSGGALQWRCAGDASSCKCTLGTQAADTCPTPKPTCCFALETTPQQCQCWAPDSETCRTFESKMPGARAVTSCPPS